VVQDGEGNSLWELTWHRAHAVSSGLTPAILAESGLFTLAQPPPPADALPEVADPAPAAAAAPSTTPTPPSTASREERAGVGTSDVESSKAPQGTTTEPSPPAAEAVTLPESPPGEESKEEHPESTGAEAAAGENLVTCFQICMSGYTGTRFAEYVSDWSSDVGRCEKEKAVIVCRALECK